MVIIGWHARSARSRPTTSSWPSWPPTRPPPASPAWRPRSAAPRARSRTARSSAPPARSTPRSTCRRSCSRSSTRPRWRSTPRCPASTSATASRARSRPPATASPRAGTASTSPPGEGAAGQVLETGEPFVSNDYQRDVALPDHAVMRRVPDRARGPDGRGTTSCAACSRSAGPRAAASTTRTCSTLEAIAGLATVACRNAEAYEHVQHVARTDALTGVLNHGAMQVRIREEIARARRDQAPARRRHPRPRRLQGRQRHPRPRRRRRAAAPRRARCCRASCARTTRSPATAATSSCCCSPAPTRRRPPQVAERCRDAIGGKCSIGVAAWHDGLDADGLLEQADRALMLAKRTGKGRVAVANPEVERELALLQSRSRLPRRRAGAGRRDRGARQLHARALRRGRAALARRRDDARPRRRGRRADRPRRAAARRRQARDARRAAAARTAR